MIDLVSRVSQAIEQEGLIASGEPLLVAVSGGCDSVVLLDVLHRLAGVRSDLLEVAHFNHQLRGAEAEADEQWVAALARRLELRFHAGRADVRQAAAQDGVSIEMAGRRLRHAFLAQTAQARGIHRIALGHHADDQVETFLLRLLRGNAGEALGGLRWLSPSPADPGVHLFRPLLECTRAQIRHYAEAGGIEWREDASNKVAEALRNRIRHHLLPLLEREYQPGLRPLIRRLMSVAGSDADLAAGLAREWLEGRGGGAFDGLHRALQRQVILRQLQRLAVAPSFELIERLIRNPEVPVAVADGRRIQRDQAGHLHLVPSETARFNPARRTLGLEGQAGSVEFDGLRLAWRYAETSEGEPLPDRVGPREEWFDAEAVGTRVTLRHWKSGDRFQPIGMAAAVKLQDLFVNLKVPRGERHRRVVAVTEAGEIFWVEGLRIGEVARVRGSTRCLLHWSWRRGSDG